MRGSRLRLRRGAFFVVNGRNRTPLDLVIVPGLANAVGLAMDLATVSLHVAQACGFTAGYLGCSFMGFDYDCRVRGFLLGELDALFLGALDFLQ